MKALYVVLPTFLVACSGSNLAKPKVDPSSTPAVITPPLNPSETGGPGSDPIISTPGTIQILISNSAVGTADLPTVAYDLASEVISIAQNQTSYTGSLAIIPSAAGFRLKDDESLHIESMNGGNASIVQVAFSSSENKGTIASDDLILRPGYPKIKAPKIDYSLETTPATVKGQIESESIAFNDVELGLTSNYDLYLQNGMWRGKMNGKFKKNGQVEEFTYDYDTPILTAIEVFPVDSNGNRLLGEIANGGKVRLVLKANSNAPLNWFNLSWDGPTSNLTGGGTGASFLTVGNCPNFDTLWTYCELSRGYWTYMQEFTISEFQPSGKYTWTVSVKNAAELTSRTMSASLNATNSASIGTKPIIVDLVATPSAGLTTGIGGNVVVELLAQSETPVNWITRSLDGPTSNQYGGGSGWTFTDCAISASKPALCGSRGYGYYYATFTDTFDNWSENGVYTYSNFSVKNASDLESDVFTSPRTFTISGNQTATTPIITLGQIYKVGNWGDDPLSVGTIITGTCLVNSAQPSNLMVALVLEVNSSNAPVNWIDRSFNGPSSNLEGGGSGTSAIDLGSGNFRVIKYSQVSAPSFAPQGLYYFDNISVKNAGNKTSNVFGDISLGFNLKASCP